MKIWIVTYGDGYTFSGIFIAAFQTEKEARDCSDELNLKCGGLEGPHSWDCQEVTLGEKPQDD